MTDSPQRYPLAWPVHKPRTPPSKRVRGTFAMKDPATGRDRPVSVRTAAERLEDQVERLGGVYPILSSNLELRLDGRPRGDKGAPADPGVCLYFQIKGEPYAMACDVFNNVAQNIAAIANHIEATRRIARYGVATAAETLQTFKALPAPADAPRTRTWREVMGFSPEFPSVDLNRQDVVDLLGRRYRTLAQEAGSEAALAELNIARDAARREFAA